jgi:hypothetical protein
LDGATWPTIASRTSSAPPRAAAQPRGGQQIIAAPASGIADELNRQLNHVFGWPFQAASGKGRHLVALAAFLVEAGYPATSAGATAPNN